MILGGEQINALRVDSKDGAIPVLVKTGRESGSGKFLSVDEKIIPDRISPPPHSKNSSNVESFFVTVVKF